MTRTTGRMIGVIVVLLGMVALWAGSVSPKVFFWGVPALQAVAPSYALMAAFACLALDGLIWVGGARWQE